MPKQKQKQKQKQKRQGHQTRKGPISVSRNQNSFLGDEFGLPCCNQPDAADRVFKKPRGVIRRVRVIDNLTTLLPLERWQRGIIVDVARYASEIHMECQPTTNSEAMDAVSLDGLWTGYKGI